MPAASENTAEPAEDGTLTPKAKTRPMRAAAARTRDETTIPTTSPLVRPADTGSGESCGVSEGAAVAASPAASSVASGNWSEGKGVMEGCGVRSSCGSVGSVSSVFERSEGNSWVSEGMGDSGTPG